MKDNGKKRDAFLNDIKHKAKNILRDSTKDFRELQIIIDQFIMQVLSYQKATETRKNLTPEP